MNPFEEHLRSKAHPSDTDLSGMVDHFKMNDMAPTVAVPISVGISSNTISPRVNKPERPEQRRFPVEGSALLSGRSYGAEERLQTSYGSLARQRAFRVNWLKDWFSTNSTYEPITQREPLNPSLAYVASFPDTTPLAGVKYFSTPDSEVFSSTVDNPTLTPDQQISPPAANINTEDEVEMGTVPAVTYKKYREHIHETSRRLLVGVCVYNEEASELQKTLVNLQEQRLSMGATELEVLVVLDGWTMAHASTKEYLNNLFFLNPERSGTRAANVTQEINLLVAEARENNTSTTIVVQPYDRVDKIEVSGMSSGIRVTFLIKGENRRKSNSHEWFLKAFAKEIRSEYVLNTDVGTTFRPVNCINNMITFMDERRRYDGVTCHQRVAMHFPPPGATFWDALMHASCAYELNINTEMISMGYNITGALSVMHGPCQLIRTVATQNQDFMQAHFSLMHRNVIGMNLLEANMQLTEDRTFTHFLMQHAPMPYIGIVVGNYFDYEPEIKPVQFLNQRRRWQNGNIASNLYLLKPRVFTEIREKHGLFAAVRITAISVFFMASILMGYLLLGIGSTMLLVNVGYGEANKTFVPLTFLEPGVQAFFCKFCAASVLLMWFSIVSFSVVHHTQKFVPWLYWWTYAITQLTVLLSISLWIWSTYERITHHADEVKPFEHFVVIGQVLTVVAPSLITLTKGDLEGFYYYTIGFFPYLITMATYIMFPFYCTARIWDLTWGNRPEDMDTNEAQDRQTVMEDVQEQSRKFLYIIFAANLAIVVFGALYGWTAAGVCVAFTSSIIMVFYLLALAHYLYELTGTWRYFNYPEWNI